MTISTQILPVDMSRARTSMAIPSDQAVGQSMYQLISELYPICRSITGDGFRKTLSILQKHIQLEVHEVPTGTQVFDWTVPREWNVRDAYVKNSRGERIVDFQKSNLHVVNYSVPVRARMRLDELREHLFSAPDHPDWIPYRTSYYKETWGFCIPHRQLLDLRDDEYEVCIDSSLAEGNLTYGDCYIQGRKADEILISCHACHPSLANDNLSGVSLSVFLAKHLGAAPREYSYRFLFIPGTIGAIVWLALNQKQTAKIKHGLVVASVGDSGKMTYKKSRRGDAEIDRAAIHVLQHSGQDYEVMDFFPYGYDERQYCSPGFNLPVGSLSRTPWGRFSQYHTSADNLELVRPESLADSFAKYLSIISVLENNRRYMNQNPYCEPQLGKRGLYTAIGGRTDVKSRELAMFWVLNLSDGRHTALEIAERSGLNFDLIDEAARILLEHGLLKEYGD